MPHQTHTSAAAPASPWQRGAGVPQHPAAVLAGSLCPSRFLPPSLHARHQTHCLLCYDNNPTVAEPNPKHQPTSLARHHPCSTTHTLACNAQRLSDSVGGSCLGGIWLSPPNPHCCRTTPNCCCAGNAVLLLPGCDHPSLLLLLLWLLRLLLLLLLDAPVL